MGKLGEALMALVDAIMDTGMENVVQLRRPDREPVGPPQVLLDQQLRGGRSSTGNDGMFRRRSPQIDAPCTTVRRRSWDNDDERLRSHTL